MTLQVCSTKFVLSGVERISRPVHFTEDGIKSLCKKPVAKVYPKLSLAVHDRNNHCTTCNVVKQRLEGVKKDPRMYQGTMPGSYCTAANGDYAIMTVQLAEGDWLATTREFKAFGDTEPEALDKLARFMREAAESIVQLAEKRAALVPVHPTDPPHCDQCGEYGCTKHGSKEAVSKQ